MGKESNQMQLVIEGLLFDAAGVHPNRMKFRGVLTRLDEPSTKAPHGSHGHRINLSSEVAEKRLSTLVGMGLNYLSSLDGHAQRRKVGVIDKAWIDGKDLRVEGTIWKHDFPEAEKDLKQPDLGMSMEIGDVRIEDPKADVWNIVDCCFLGGTILFKNAAAYYRTQAIAAQAAGGGNRMKPTLKKKTAAKPVKQLDEERVVEIVAQAMSGVLTQTLSRQNRILTGIEASISRMDSRLESLETSAEDSEDVQAAEEDDDEDKHDGEDEDGDDDGEDGEDEGDMETRKVKAGVDEDEKPGNANEGAKNKGDKTDEEDEIGPDEKKPITGSAVAQLQAQMRKLEKRMNARLQAVNAENSDLKKQLATTKIQVTAAAADTNRRTLDPTTVALLAKANVSADDIRQSGMKLGTAEVDAILASTPGLDNQTRIAFKQTLHKAGLMEDGQVIRNRPN